MSRVRPPAVAGRFYPADPSTLGSAVRRHLEAAGSADRTGPSPDAPVEALIVPHAGYDFSGPVAGSAYHALARSEEARRGADGSSGGRRRVVLVGPAHYRPVDGLAVPSVGLLRTPLGDVPVDRGGVEVALTFPHVAEDDAVHAPEHSLETQLPFLQEVLGDFAVVPLLAGRALADEVAEVLAALLAEPGGLLVVSSDLSHYLGYDEARARDARTASSIESFAPERIGPEDACGWVGVRALLEHGRQGLVATTLDLRNSGDTSGRRDRVVGYGAFAFGARDA